MGAIFREDSLNIYKPIKSFIERRTIPVIGYQDLKQQTHIDKHPVILA